MKTSVKVICDRTAGDGSREVELEGVQLSIRSDQEVAQVKLWMLANEGRR